MSITTMTGDDGTTGLWSGGRVAKDDLRIEALGEVDEVSSFLGFARLACRLDANRSAIEELQRNLVRVAGELASTDPAFDDPIQAWDEKGITERIYRLESGLKLAGFVLPGRTEASARLDLARVSARGLERRVVALSRTSEVSSHLRRYLNRLSDYLFLLARAEEAAEGKIEYA